MKDGKCKNVMWIACHLILLHLEATHVLYNLFTLRQVRFATRAATHAL